MKKISTVHAIAIGRHKGKPKDEVQEAYLRKDHGIDGDCHAGPGHRQISLLAWEDVALLKRKGINARPGDFAENLTIRGVDFSDIDVGSRMWIGNALIEVTEIGKSEWKEGDYSFQGVALVARSGLFARVIEGSWIRPGVSIAAAKRISAEDKSAPR